MHKVLVSQPRVVSVFVFKSVIFFSPDIQFTKSSLATCYNLYYIPVHKNLHLYVLIAFRSRRHVDVELGKRETAKGPRREAAYLLKFKRLDNGSVPEVNHYTCAPGNDTFLTLRAVFWR